MANSISIPLNGDFYSFEQADQYIEEFESFLLQYGITIEIGSQLERLALSVYDVLHKHRTPSAQDPQADIRPWLRDVSGMNDLIYRLIREKDNPSISSIVPHLKLLNKGNPLQNQPIPVTDQASNKVFELLIAVAAMTHADDVRLDNPDKSKGNNPDVLAYYGNDLWGFACKVAHARKGKTIFDLVLSGIDQIERSPADVGVVIVNLKNLIDHDRYWPITNQEEWENGAEPEFGAYRDSRIATAFFLTELEEIAELLFGKIPKTEINRALSKKKCIPTFFYFGSSTVGIVANGVPVITSIGFLRSYDVGQVDQEEMEIFNLLNDGFQRRPRLGKYLTSP